MSAGDGLDLTIAPGDAVRNDRTGLWFVVSVVRDESLGSTNVTFIVPEIARKNPDVVKLHGRSPGWPGTVVIKGWPSDRSTYVNEFNVVWKWRKNRTRSTRGNAR